MFLRRQLMERDIGARRCLWIGDNKRGATATRHRQKHRAHAAFMLPPLPYDGAWGWGFPLRPADQSRSPAVPTRRRWRLREMSIRKTLIAALALAIAVAFSPLPELQAATFVNPGSQPGSDNLTQSAKMKRKAKPAKVKRSRKHRRAKRAGSRG